ncbi:MAG: RdgB/HAM1 family non-canonical purine NTP pyrophosphatase [Acidobacteria bacterium]|nr:RdgB/HAM1 family non-canonical purine NTP pyrophosphatase [Acidobacteriota bacterium]
MLSNTAKLVVATSNPGKLAELRQMLAETPVSVLSLANFGSIVEIEETGSTFAENAIMKAAGYAGQTGLPTLADDSGLEIEALGGRPGIHSARYGGDMIFAEKMGLVLAELLDTATNNRRARFVSSIAFASADGAIIHTVEGECSGIIAEDSRGNGGFGYDPIFVPDGYDQTFGELADSIKEQISHRSRAFSKIIPYLRDFYSV